MKTNDQPLRPRFVIGKKRISEQRETVTPDKILYVELDEEITILFDRIKRVKGKIIALVIPKRASILHSIINLKILKKKTDEEGKRILVVTVDPTGAQLAEKAGFEATQRLFGNAENDEPKPQPVLSSKFQRPVKTAEEKISIASVIRQEKTSFFDSFIAKIKERIKKKKQAAARTRIVFVTANKQALFTLVLVSIFLLLVVAYIALPGATVAITPRSTVLDPAFNVTFMDYEKNRDAIENNFGSAIVLASFPVTPPAFTKKIIHNATGKLFNGENARGTTTIINLSDAPWDLAARTRFQTDEGIVFRISSEARVPSSSAAGPGTLDVLVVADPFDATGQVVGERGNIPPSRFFLPGLKNEENKRKLYGESREAMTGGATATVKMVTEEDISAASQTAKQKAIKGASEDLKKYLEEDNIARKRNLSLLSDRNTVKISEPVVSAPVNLVGTAADQFEVTVTFSARGVAFDRQQLVDTLKQRVASRVDPDKKLLHVYEDDISYKFLDEDEARGRIRLTASMRALQAYELDPEKENGHRFIKKISDHIAGMRVDDALTYLQQQTDEISRVEITTWPVWAPTIPNIADNIKFVIREEKE